MKCTSSNLPAIYICVCVCDPKGEIEYANIKYDTEVGKRDNQAYGQESLYFVIGLTYNLSFWGWGTYSTCTNTTHEEEDINQSIRTHVCARKNVVYKYNLPAVISGLKCSAHKWHTEVYRQK